MDSYFPKTRRPKGGLLTPLKRPAPAISPPTAVKVPNTPTTPKDSRIVKSLVAPAAPRKSAVSRRVLDRAKPVSHRELFGESPPQPSLNATAAVAASTRTHPHADKNELGLSPLRTATIKSLISSTTPKSRLPTKESALPVVGPAANGSPLKLLPLPASPVVVRPKKLLFAQQQQQPQTHQKLPQQPESPSKIGSGPLKGVSSSLLDIVRAKEAAARLADPELERRKELISIAPEIVRIVPTVFTSSKKGILLYDGVVDKCFKGLKSNYTSSSIMECLDLLEKTVIPDWISTVTISKGKFMRINKDITKPQLLEAIQRFKRDHLN